MKQFLLFPLLLLSLTLFSVVGCGGSGGSTNLVGEWEGRAERAAERTLRDWPGEPKPESEADVPNNRPTDLEQLSEVQVHLAFRSGNRVTLDWAGKQQKSGKWTFISTEEKRGLLEIVLEQEANEGEESVAKEEGERRRFEIEFLKPVEDEPDRFVLNEEGADTWFGRLLFERQTP